MFFVYRAIKKKKKKMEIKIIKCHRVIKYAERTFVKRILFHYIHPSVRLKLSSLLFFFFFFISHELSIFTDCIKQDLGR